MLVRMRVLVLAGCGLERERKVFAQGTRRDSPRSDFVQLIVRVNRYY
jgi:hypothetical protein